MLNAPGRSTQPIAGMGRSRRSRTDWREVANGTGPVGWQSRRAQERFARAAVTVGAAAYERPHERRLAGPAIAVGYREHGTYLPVRRAAPGLIKPVGIQIIREGPPSPVIHRC
jgi:hypothetical protein